MTGNAKTKLSIHAGSGNYASAQRATSVPLTCTRFFDHNQTLLPPMQRKIMKRFFVRREKTSEIAVHLRITEKLVRALLNEAVSKVQKLESRKSTAGLFAKAPQLKSCECCGRKLKSHDLEVLCRTCVDQETKFHLFERNHSIENQGP